MAPIRRRKINISLLIPFAIVALVFGALIWKKMQDSREPHPVPQVNQTDSTRKVVLFFVAEGAGLAREARELPSCTDTEACVKDLLDELFSGPVGELDEALPEGAELTGVRLEGDLAVVDVDQGFCQRPAVRQFGGDAGGLFDRQYGLLQLPADHQGPDHGRGQRENGPEASGPE